MIKKEMDVFIWKDGKVIINSELAWVFYTQHGFPVEMFEEMVNEQLPPKSFLRGYHISKAYDKVHSTNFAKKYLEIEEQLCS